MFYFFEGVNKMGCFSVSCSISKLSINAGDKCTIIPIFTNPINSIKEEYERTVLCGPCDKCLPLTLPIVGYYDDYGGIEYIEKNENTEIIEEYFGISIEEFIQSVLYNSYEKVKDKNKRDILEKVYFMYVLYDVYEYSCYNFRTLSYTKETEIIRKFRSDIKNCNEDISLYSSCKKYYNNKDFYDLVLTSMKYKIENILPFNCGRGFQYSNENFINIYLRTVFDGKNFHLPSDFMFKEYVDFYYFMWSMIYTNSVFDIVRQGTQSGETEIELQNMKLYCSILEKRLEKKEENH